jgi:hypothetical protein
MGCRCRTPQAADLTASRAAMCQTCRHAKRAATGSAVACTINGREVIALAHEPDSCPAARHPDGEGRVRWLGLDWLGVPEPLRWRLVWALGREPRGLVGCGCLASQKASWAGPWLEPWLEGLQTLRSRLAALMDDWRACRADGL